MSYTLHFTCQRCHHQYVITLSPPIRNHAPVEKARLTVPVCKPQCLTANTEQNPIVLRKKDVQQKIFYKDNVSHAAPVVAQ